MNQISNACAAIGRRSFGLFLAVVAPLAGIASSASAQNGSALKDMTIGREDAPVTLIEYASMTCPHCAEFHEKALPRLKAEYIETGRVRLVYRDFPLDGWALRAAMLARCAGPERFFGFVDIIYQLQRVWTRSTEPLKNLEHMARLGGMGGDAFSACMEDKQTQEYVVQSRLDAQRKYKINGTPSFVIDDKTISGVDNFEGLKKILDPLLNKTAKP